MVLIALCAVSNDKPLDFWDEEIRLFGVAQADQNIDFDLSERLEISYSSSTFNLDHSIKKGFFY